MHKRKIDWDGIIKKITIILMSIAIFMMLTGCTGGPAQFIDTHVDGPKLMAVDPRPIQMNDITWIIISDKNIDKYIDDITSGKLVIIGLNPLDYQDLSINLMQLVNYIQSQQSVIAAYREFYEYLKDTKKDNSQTYFNYLYDSSNIDNFQKEVSYLKINLDDDEIINENKFNVVTGVKSGIGWGQATGDTFIYSYYLQGDKLSKEGGLDCDEFITKA